MRNSTVHDHVWSEARRMSKRPEVQEEYVQEAWLAISQAPAQKTDDYYMEVATTAIESARWQEYKDARLLHRAHDPTGDRERWESEGRAFASGCKKTPERMTDQDPNFMKTRRNIDLAQ